MNKVIEIMDSDEDSQTVTAASTTNNMEINESPLAQSRRRPRKSALQAMDDPEVQFAVELVEDNDKNSNAQEGQQETNNVDRAQQWPAAASTSSKTTPKILTTKPPTNAEVVQAAYDEYLNRLDTMECMANIAHERVRINYLLSTFGMPEINFSLYTPEETLKLQFKERLKQLKMMQNLNTQREKNFLPNKNDDVVE
ncbi:uncharacterized protein LOC106093594 [Stomoxys calcitrans]|uniref:uncharacterized protein LOC106093594 n=1 Tax=Stomoxys calcitrans TaxID=35570 RepID=UPI0027E30AFB|nr:uncharacterized protein LOC106093594 [Stomoxys calcitrans]